MRFSAAIDLGGTNIGVGIVREDGVLVHHSSVPVKDTSSPESIISQIAEAVYLCAKEAEIKLSALEFVGIGVPGISDSKKGPVIFAPNISWRGVDLSFELERKLGLSVLLGNDADCAALGEYHFGCGKSYDTMLMLTLGTGVGGAIVTNGRLFKAFGPHGGEFGHIPLVHGGLTCGCGKRGCFEVYCSAPALKRQTREAATEHPESLIWEMCGGDLKKVGGRTAFDAAENGDKIGAAVVEEYISYLADGISGLINILRPDAVVIGGGVSNQGASLLEPLNDAVASLCYSHESVTPPPVIKAALGNKAGVIGAGMLGFWQDEGIL